MQRAARQAIAIVAVAWMALGTALAAGPAPKREIYAAPEGTCDGYPRLDIGMAAGFCAGLVVGPTAGDATRRMALPRSLAQVGDAVWLVSDLGGWGTRRGAIWKLETLPGKTATLTPLIEGLNLPHALTIGTDGMAYVGEMSRIIRFDPHAAEPRNTIETVIAGLPDNRLHENRHPLSKFVFAPDGALLVNVGAPSDQCLDAAGKPLGETCPEADSGDRAASLRRYPRVGDGRWSADYTIHAKGLRNSVALAVHPSGKILQGENSYDFGSRWAPFDEINLIEAGRHYGWPYCADIASPTHGWKSSAAMICSSTAHTRPIMLLPPHAAPLDMLWYEGTMFPALKGRLLMTWHGYRSVGGRIVAFATDAAGMPIPEKAARYSVYGGRARLYGVGPAANALILTPGWNELAGRRPQGSPVGLAVARDGAIWTTDDRAGLVIRIAADRP